MKKMLALFALVYLLRFRDGLIIKLRCVMGMKKIRSLMKILFFISERLFEFEKIFFQK